MLLSSETDTDEGLPNVKRAPKFELSLNHAKPSDIFDRTIIAAAVIHSPNPIHLFLGLLSKSYLADSHHP